MASIVWDGCLNNGVANADGVASIKCFEPLFHNLVAAVLFLSGVALFLLLIVGGFNFMLAGGDPKKMEKAKGTLTGALTGIIILTVAFLILTLISQFTGVPDILKFNITIIPN
jgi:hypothetical protein